MLSPTLALIARHATPSKTSVTVFPHPSVVINLFACVDIVSVQLRALIIVRTINGGNTEEILLLSAWLPAVRSLRSRETEARMHNFMMYDAAYRLR